MKIKSGVKQKVALGIVCVLVVTYTIYHVATLFSEDILTYAAGITTEETVLNYNGYIFRDEEVLTSDHTGVVDYKVNDGTKVSEGQAVAEIYSEGKKDQAYIEKLDKQIYVLEQSIKNSNSDIVSQKNQVGDTYDAIVKLLSSGDASGLSYQSEKFLVGMNTVRETVDKDNENSREMLDKLYAERDQIFYDSGSSVECNVDRPGYFFSQTDGCEDEFTVSALENITVDEFFELTEYADKARPYENAYGKMSDSSEWKIVLAINEADRKYFEEGKIYTALFAQNNQTNMPLFLERIVSEDGQEKVLLIFDCDRQPERFTFNRCQGVSITVSSVSGIYIPKAAVARDKGRGVYVLRGSVVYFRYFEILYEGSDYYIVKSDSEHEGDRYYIRANDMVILNGQNMFDGRVLD